MSDPKMQLEDWLDDLCVRFIINLPREELESVERICFQVEEAQWFYEDFIRPLDPGLPSLSLKAFALRIFQHCPLMSQWSHYHHITAFSEFLAYKTRVPVRGAIMLNQDMDEVVLVKGWKKGANWSFPRGKINKDEKDLDCAIREVYEETGFEIRNAGLVKEEKDTKFIEITMREQHMRLYVFRGVPRDAYFEPRTRKEISKIEWYKLSELPTLKKNKQQEDQGFAVANANKFYMVAPFLHPLKKWIAQQKKIDAKTQPGAKHILQAEGDMSMDEGALPSQVPVEMAALSDLPEVTSTHDASSHLKRLLNISSGVPVQAQFPPTQPVQAPNTEISKSNALLALLRGGSQDAVPQVSGHKPPSPPHATHPGAIPQPQQPFPGPNVSPGFPQLGQFPHQPFNYPPLHHGPPPPHLVPATVPPMNPLHPVGLQGIPHFPAGAPSQSHHERLLRSGPGSHVLPPNERPAPAPFHRTGDPQFSHPAQPPHIQGAAVPPASKLPPPKLTSHSLALLNVFKDESSKTPRGTNATLVPTSEGTTVQGRKPSQHQDQLLSLLRGSPATSTTKPVELSGQPVSPARKQILQRTRVDAQPAKRQPVADTANTQTGEPRISATVSGPLNMPNFEGIAKSPGRRTPNGHNRKTNKDRQPQSLASPITILARPQSAKRDQSPGTTAAHAPKSPSARPASQTRSNRAKNTESTKPFQPQILRRSDKVDFENSGSALPKAAAEPVQYQGTSVPRDGSEQPGTHANFDRRPSQTAAQKETLLSLFGRQSISPGSSPSGPLNIHISAAKQSATPSVVSPLSPMNFPAGGEPVSRRESLPEVEPPTSTPRKVSTPGNKAFLLGFLEGVAKGNK